MGNYAVIVFMQGDALNPSIPACQTSAQTVNASDARTPAMGAYS
jgi:hypothetical protein